MSAVQKFNISSCGSEAIQYIGKALNYQFTTGPYKKTINAKKIFDKVKSSNNLCPIVGFYLVEKIKHSYLTYEGTDVAHDYPELYVDVSKVMNKTLYMEFVTLGSVKF